MLRMGRQREEITEEKSMSKEQTTTLPQPDLHSGNVTPQRNAGTIPQPVYRANIEPTDATRAVSESESLARDIKDGSLSCFVGAGTMITGESNFKAMLRIDGHFSGRIKSDAGTLIVSVGGQVDSSANGQVDSSIEVAVALINGTVNGNITASKRVELGRAAKVVGNIQAPTLSVEQGAVFEGQCHMIQQKAA
ncbi:MAG: bactofilin family protein, partial [Pyrinomonadaceae bacterium]